MGRRTVVPQSQRPNEQQFHTLMLMGLLRAQSTLGGRGALADAMRFSGKALDKVFGGSTPHKKRIWDLLDHEPTALDDIAGAYGKRIVDKDAVCTGDVNAAPTIVSLLKKIIEAEADGHTDHAELLDMETELREARGLIDNLVHQIDEIRKPGVA